MPGNSRASRRAARQPKPPSERDWERSALLEPLPAERMPRMISDGGGLPFAPSALASPTEPLSAEDPAVAALLAHLALHARPRGGVRNRLRRGSDPPPQPPTTAGWRLLARTDDEALFGTGSPPQLLTVAVRYDQRRRAWIHAGSSRARPLRATREGIRASSWRVDPIRPPEPHERTLRILVTEQTFSGGQRAEGRVLPPDLHLDEHQLILTVYVTPRPGFQAGSSNPETPVRIALAEPLGPRVLVDGGLIDPTALPRQTINT
jgi:hypothetical protein